MRSPKKIVRENADRPRVITDKERLNWLDKQSSGDDWIARQSTTGRGYRLHNSRWHGGSPTVREAIDRAIREQEKPA